MAATVDVREGNGAGPTWTVVTAAKFCTDDDYNPGSNNPIPIPAAGTNYSYWKSHELYLSGTYTSISNIKIYTDGALGWGAGVTCQIAVKTGDYGVPPASYDQASGTPGDTGDEVVATHTWGFTGKTDLFTFTSGAPCDVDAGPYSTPPEQTDHVVLQLDVTTTATPGEKTPETIWWRYDEV